MKLNQTYLSPFPPRVRLLTYAKGVDVENVEPRGLHNGVEREDLDINPIGRIPALVLDDGRILPDAL